jgi:hypothetical protein
MSELKDWLAAFIYQFKFFNNRTLIHYDYYDLFAVAQKGGIELKKAINMFNQISKLLKISAL